MPFAVMNNNPAAPLAALERGRAYVLGANIRMSAAFTGDIFAVKNGTLWTLRVCVEATLGFDPTTPVASSQSMRIRRFTGAAAAGGTNLITVIGRQNKPASQAAAIPSTVADARASDGTAALTAPGSIETKDVRTIFAARSNATVVVLPETVFDVPIGEGFTIQAVAATVIGDLISLNFSWYEC